MQSSMSQKNIQSLEACSRAILREAADPRFLSFRTRVMLENSCAIDSNIPREPSCDKSSTIMISDRYPFIDSSCALNESRNSDLLKQVTRIETLPRWFMNPVVLSIEI